MDQSTQTSDPHDSERRRLNDPKTQTPAPQTPSPAPTPPATDTPAQSSPNLTRTFNPTAPTIAVDVLPDTPLVKPGFILDGYEIIEIIGRGGMGLVMKARQPESGQVVALKMIRDGVFADQESRDRFMQEILALGRVQPAKNIIPIYHVGKHENEPYYVMPYLAQGTLSRSAKRFQSDRRLAVALLEKLARAVHKLHQNKIIHRDIKPSNIFLDGDEPFLGDFGLVKLLDRETTLTTAWQKLGTPSYMAPEQTGLFRASVTSKADIWSLGVLLYELLVGKRPFMVAKEEETTTLLWNIVHQKPAAPRAVKPEVERELEAIILKCLEKEPEDRFETAEELADELARWLRGERVQTRAPGGLRRVGRSIRKHRVFALSCFGLVVVLSIAIPSIVYVRNPERGLERIQAALAAGETAPLIPPQSQPIYARMLHGEQVTLTTDADGYYTVRTFDRAMLELARDLPIDRYKIRGKIRHDASEFFGEVGIFFGRHDQGMPFGRYALYYQVAFNDVVATGAKRAPPQVKEPILNWAQFRPMLFAEVKGGDWTHYPFSISRAGPSFVAAGQSGGKWREIEIAVTPTQLKMSFDRSKPYTQDLGARVARLRRDLDDSAKQNPATFAVLRDCDTRFDASGSLGIFVEGGAAAFSDFILEPLPKE